MHRIRLGNAEVDGKAIGANGDKIAVEIKTPNDDLVRGIDQLTEGFEFLLNSFIDLWSAIKSVEDLGEIHIRPSTVRVEKISLLDFLRDLPEILKSVSELTGVKATGVSLSHPQASISMSMATEDSFNLSASDPFILEKLTESMKKFYAKKMPP